MRNFPDTFNQGRSGIFLVLLVVLFLALSACGYRGPLYLPGEPATEPSQDSVSQAQEQEGDQEGEQDEDSDLYEDGDSAR